MPAMMQQITDTARAAVMSQERYLRLTKSEWALVAVIVGALATTISSLDHWGDITHPGIFGGLLALFATHLGAWAAGRASAKE